MRRNDGVAAYNLAVVVDDAASGVDQVVRGDDLLPAAINQAYLATVLGAAPPTYAHVPLAVNADGRRLAKRDGAVTMPDLAAVGVDATAVLALIAESLGLPAPRRLPDLFDVVRSGPRCRGNRGSSLEIAPDDGEIGRSLAVPGVDRVQIPGMPCADSRRSSSGPTAK